MPARSISFKGMVASPRINGIANEFLAYLFNPVGSGVQVAVRRLSIQNDYTTNTGTIRTLIVSAITSAPTGGTAHTPVPFDTVGSHVSAVEFRSAASADGVATAITGTATAKAWMQYPMRLTDITATGQVIIDDASMVPDLVAGDPLFLAEGEGLLVSANAAPSSAQHFIVNLMFEEFTYVVAAENPPPIPVMAPYVAYTSPQ